LETPRARSADAFATLWFPHSLNKEGATIPVTGIQTSAALLISINSQLLTIGYTIAIEYVFYVFFGLCLMAMVSGFLNEKLRVRGAAEAHVLSMIEAWDKFPNRSNELDGVAWHRSFPPSRLDLLRFPSSAGRKD